MAFLKGDKVYVEAEVLTATTSKRSGDVVTLIVEGKTGALTVPTSIVTKREKRNYVITDVDFQEDRTPLAENIRAQRHRLNVSQTYRAGGYLRGLRVHPYR
jgi:hypothetical protein